MTQCEQHDPLARQQQLSSNVGIFWDLENCSLPHTVSILEAIVRIRELVSPSTASRLSIYSNARLLNSCISDEQALELHVSKHPINEKGKDSADKRLIADLALFVLDQQLSGFSPPTIVLISTDIDFFYVLGELRTRGAKVILVHGSSVNQSVMDCTDERFDWYTLVRGINTPKIRKAVNIPKTLNLLEKTLERMVFVDKHLITETNIRSTMKYDGKHNDAQWLELRKDPQFDQLLGCATQKQETIGAYDPQRASWDSFSVIALRELYRILVMNPGCKKKGKYPLALFIRSQIPEREFPIAQMLEFVELSIQQSWITKDGSSYTISYGLLQNFPHEVVFPKEAIINPLFPTTSVQLSHNVPTTSTNILQHLPNKALLLPPLSTHSQPQIHDNQWVDPLSHHNPNISMPRVQHYYQGLQVHYQNPPQYQYQYYNSHNQYQPSTPPPFTQSLDMSVILPQRKKVSEEQAKAALQFYFQTNRLGLPKYECRKTGQDHLPIFEVTVHVVLADRSNNFFGYGQGSLKKQAEKLAALNSCQQILTMDRNYQFPDIFCEDK